MTLHNTSTAAGKRLDWQCHGVPASQYRYPVFSWSGGGRVLTQMSRGLIAIVAVGLAAVVTIGALS